MVRSSYVRRGVLSEKFSGCTGALMGFKITNMTEMASDLWERRSEALEAGNALMSDKPDVEDWTEKERRLWFYALAIGRRLDSLQ